MQQQNQQQNPLVGIQQQLLSTEGHFQNVLVDQSLHFQAEAEFAMQAFRANALLVSAARSAPESVRDCIHNVAAIGVTLNPAEKLAYLVPRNGRVCLDISYMGLVEVARRGGAVQWAKAVMVRAGDHYESYGLGEKPKHVYNPFAPESVRGEKVGGYVLAKLANGDYLTEEMSLEAIHRIRDRSSGWQAFQNGKIKSTPWATDEEEMEKKTIIKRAYKSWPKTPALSQAIDYLNREGGEGLADLAEDGAHTHGPEGDVLGGLLAQVQQAQSEQGLVQIWQQGLADVRAMTDRNAARAVHQAFKEAVTQRGQELKQVEANTYDGQVYQEAAQ